MMTHTELISIRNTSLHWNILFTLVTTLKSVCELNIQVSLLLLSSIFLITLFPSSSWTGCLRFEELYNNAPGTDFLGLAAAQIDESTPLYTEIKKDKDGKLVASPTLSQKQVFDHPKWFFVQKMFNQEYFEVKRDDC